MSKFSKKISGFSEDLKKCFARPINPSTTKAASKKDPAFPNLNISLNLNQDMINSFFLRNEGINLDYTQTKTVSYP